MPLWRLCARLSYRTRSEAQKVAERGPARRGYVRAAAAALPTVAAEPELATATGRALMEYVPGEGEDETTLDVPGERESLGFTGQFMPREGGQVECLTCHRLSPADETVFRELRRLEGASDPDDMLAV